MKDLFTRLESALTATDALLPGGLDDISHADVASFIAEKLNEPGPATMKKIYWLVKYFGRVRMVNLLRDTFAIEAAGGQLTNETPPRRRSPGGVFFKLANPLWKTKPRPEKQPPPTPVQIAETLLEQGAKGGRGKKGTPSAVPFKQQEISRGRALGNVPEVVVIRRRAK